MARSDGSAQIAAVDEAGTNTIPFFPKLAASAAFNAMFREGMSLVEDTAAYLDGPGREESRNLPRPAALAYATESMRLTTRLMQVASWLLLQRAVNEGELTPAQARSEKHRVRLGRTGRRLSDRGVRPAARVAARLQRQVAAVAGAGRASRSRDERRPGDAGRSAAQRGDRRARPAAGRLRRLTRATRRGALRRRIFGRIARQETPLRRDQDRPMAAAPTCRLYLFTPLLALGDLDAFAPRFAAALAAGDVASALIRVAPTALGDAKRIGERLIEAAGQRDAAILLDGDARLAARIGADGVHIGGVGEALKDALASLHPERIVGAGGLRGRDDAMAAGEAGADYVMFGEPRRDGWTPPLADIVERVGWWAEIFETPCVAYAAELDDVAALAAAGADFVALGDAVWAAPSPELAIAAAESAARQAAAARAEANA